MARHGAIKQPIRPAEDGAGGAARRPGVGAGVAGALDPFNPFRAEFGSARRKTTVRLRLMVDRSLTIRRHLTLDAPTVRDRA
jgi:hypothetical protein